MASLPTIQMVRPGKGLAIVNERDRDVYLAQGWTLPGADPAPTPDPAAEGAGDASQPPEGRKAALSVLSVPDLKEAAKGLDITGAANLKKADLIEAILAAEGEVDEADEDEG